MCVYADSVSEYIALGVGGAGAAEAALGSV